MKTCSRCQQTKERSNFGKRGNTSDGLTPQCKSCSAIARAKIAYVENEKKRAFYAANREQCAEDARLSRKLREIKKLEGQSA